MKKHDYEEDVNAVNALRTRRHTWDTALAPADFIAMTRSGRMYKWKQDGTHRQTN